MTSNNEIPRPVMQGVLDQVYRVAEGLFLTLGGHVPEGCKFARSIDEIAEHCYNVAVIVCQNYQFANSENDSKRGAD